MLEIAESVLLIVSALFPIVNPIGGGPVFLAMTRDYTAQKRRALARRVAINSFLLLIGSFTIGSHVLSFFEVSLPVVQVGGGLIVISTAWSMLKQKDEHERGAMRGMFNPDDVAMDAFYPLTLPLTVGAGSITTAITLGANEPHQLRAGLLAIVAAAIGSAVVAVSIYVCYGFADRLAVIIGPAGMNVILRLTSFLLVCIGVQILWNGVRTLLKSL
jgi:multiple antibiotic resistance protein